MKTPPETPLGYPKRGPAGWSTTFLIDLLGVFCIFFIYAGSAVPAINEPHYWTKAAHFWNPDFGKNDLFLESGDAHWLFFATFGYLTQVMPLVWAVWTGRLITWVCLAFAMTLLGRSIWMQGSIKKEAVPSTQPLVATAFAAVWLAGLHWGHWAGEWVVGGCESKGIAYAFIFLGIAMSIRNAWTWTWVCLGLAAAFHVVAGMWVIACMLFVSLWIDSQPDESHQAPFLVQLASWVGKHKLGWAICLIGILVGVIPALRIDWGADPKIATDSAVMQAYRRLGHHLSPSRFSAERWRGFAGMLAVVAGVSFIAIRSTWLSSQPESAQQSDTPSSGTRGRWQRVWKWFLGSERGFQIVALCALFSMGVALLGFVIDLTLSKNFGGIAAKILRFYWFRWNDVALPMYLSAIVVSIAYSKLVFNSHPVLVRNAFWVGMFGAGALLLAVRFLENFNEQIPAGDKAHFVAKTDTEDDQTRQYRDWLNVCEWISHNTDPSGLWLTPRRQQSFKWRTGRPELACWKDAPQNAVALVEWGERLADAYKFEGEKKVLQPLTDQKLWDLHKKYAIRYLLLDRRVANQTPPTLPILYPNQNGSNETFWVFEFPANLSTDVSPEK
jgi:hypothetical protein